MAKKLCTLMLASALLLCGCGAAVETAPLPEETVEKGYNFTFVCPIIDNEYWQDCIDGIAQADREFGSTTTVIGPHDAENFSVEIVDYMQQAVSSDTDGIMLYAGIETLYPLIDEAAGKGVPVLAIDSDAPGTKRLAYVGTSPNCGHQAGEKLVELTGGEAVIGILVSSLSAEKEMEVIHAFQDSIADYNIEMAAFDETDADPDVAEEKVRQMLKLHPEITAIFSTAGYNVTGAARVKKAEGLDDLILIGFDDVPENLAFVREGVIDVLLVQSPWQMGYQGVQLLMDCVDKGGLPRDSYDTGVTMVTRENVETYK